MILSIDSGYDKQNNELLLNYWYTSLNIYTVHVDQEIFIVLLSVQATKKLHIHCMCKYIIVGRVLSHDSKNEYLAQIFYDLWY